MYQHDATATTSPIPRERAESWRDVLHEQHAEGWERVREHGDQRREHLSARTTYVLADAIQWLAELPSNSIHAVVTDPPYGVVEYDEKNHKKLRAGRGGVWRCWARAAPVAPGWVWVSRDSLRLKIFLRR